MDGAELEIACPCGFENFERIVVQRKPHPPIVTDFALAWAARRCTGRLCARSTRLSAVSGGMMGIGGPEKQPIDSDAKLKRDAADAAHDYRKPGRSGRR